jgi:hypothetical protein
MRPVLLIVICALMASFIEGRSQSQVREESTVPPISSKTVKIFPNPTNEQSEYISVRVDHLKSDKVSLFVHNIIGNSMPVETEIVDEHELRIRIKDLASGYYFVTVQDDASKSHDRCTQKVLKKF